jgi:hypothetical protein
MIVLGREAFRRWGAPAPIALRTGGLQVDRTVYRAMAKMGLRLASNVGWGYFEPREDELRVAAGLRRIEGVLEAPVVTYRQMSVGPLKPLRLCTITSTSRTEMESLLRQAGSAAISPFVILTHPFELVRYFGAPAPASPSRINLARIEALCALLAAERRLFRTTTFGEGEERWSALPAQSFPPLKAPPLATAARVVENKLNELSAWNCTFACIDEIRS